MRFTELQQWLHWLETNHPNEIDLGLGRVAKVAALMGFDFTDTKVITIAGTNGKGSCVAVLESLLSNSGITVGAFTSPHLLRFNERIALNGIAVEDSEIVTAFDRIDRCRGEISLTYFEFATLAGLDIFCRAELEVVLLEVGLGGRLDSVNIIDPDIAIVTSIAIDHVDWLGDNRESIGFEKAGIFRSGRAAICADPEPPQSVIDRAEALGAPLYLVGRDFQLQVDSEQQGHWRGLDAAGVERQLAQLALPQLPEGSIAAALQALALLGPVAKPFLDKVDFSGLAQLQFAGRFHRVDIAIGELVLDVAHNPAAATFLASQLHRAPVGRNIALVAIMADKDVEGIVDALRDSFDYWILADLLDNSRALGAEQLAEVLRHQGIDALQCCASVELALQLALDKMTATDRLVVFGSSFTVAEAMQFLPQSGSAGAESAHEQ